MASTTSPAPGGRLVAAVLEVAVLVVLAVVQGCGASGARHVTDQAAATPVDELGAHGGEVCPEQLPPGRVADHGFDTDEPAEGAPVLTEPESGWLCRYTAVEAETSPSVDGIRFVWERVGTAVEVDEAHLPALAEGLDRLEPAESGRPCPADLGPRWMFVYAVGGDLSGVVVDDFGCRDVRLTDDPFETPPGEATQRGTAPESWRALPRCCIESRRSREGCR